MFFEKSCPSNAAARVIAAASADNAMRPASPQPGCPNL